MQSVGLRSSCAVLRGGRVQLGTYGSLGAAAAWGDRRIRVGVGQSRIEVSFPEPTVSWATTRRPRLHWSATGRGSSDGTFALIDRVSRRWPDRQ